MIEGKVATIACDLFKTFIIEKEYLHMYRGSPVDILYFFVEN
jgi:hypothetical protein